MSKRKYRSSSKKQRFIRKIHIQAIVFLIVYTIISKTVFIKAITSPNLAVAFLVPYFFGVVAGIIFLYLFSHEDFFHFIREVEKEEKSKEKSYLKKYLHYGKIISTLIIATIGGPVFAALTIRFLLKKYKYKYLLIALGNIGSTLFFVSLTRGALSFIGFR